MRKDSEVPYETSEIVLLVRQGEGHECNKESDASCDKKQ